MNTKFNARFPQVVAGNPDDAPSSAEQAATDATAARLPYEDITVDRLTQPLCDTTMTPRNPRTDCGCDTYAENLGPCDTFCEGSEGNCAYCDHSQNCHLAAAYGLDLKNLPELPQEPPSREALEKLAAEFREKFNARPGIKLLPNGSIALEVVIDEDLAGALLEWAEGAGEDPATWINRQINEALLSFCGK